MTKNILFTAVLAIFAMTVIGILQAIGTSGVKDKQKAYEAGYMDGISVVYDTAQEDRLLTETELKDKINDDFKKYLLSGN
jgi:hypothetical protein